MTKVFISYSRSDGDFADLLSTRLEKAGLESWIDVEGLQPGQDWSKNIDDAIRDSAALIVIVTPAATQSIHVSYEWAFALGAGLTVIPVLLEPAQVHERLGALQHLDFTQRQTRPWQQLLDALEDAIKAQPSPSIKLDRAAPPLVKESVAALDSPDEQVMEQAIARLAEMDLPAAEAALVGALSHPLPDVRIAAARRLARRGNPKALPGLIEGTRRQRWHHDFERQAAQIGLAAIPGLRAALKAEGPAVRRDLVGALQEIGDPTVVPDLITLARDPDAGVRQAAIRGLRRFATPEALRAIDESMPLLIQDLQDENGEVRYEASQLLEQLGTEPAIAAIAEWKRKQSELQ